ncbi:MAG: hypothetical protein HYR60_23275 [Acidobacteria bacterium]|nr:hypothetical protein [Acidobacteriota bacterium]
MSHFEDQLRSALRRKQPPAGFEDRVMSRVGPRRSLTGWRWATAAIAASLMLSVGGYGYRQYQGYRAKQQLMLALEITGSKLALAERRIDQLSQRSFHE